MGSDSAMVHGVLFASALLALGVMLRFRINALQRLHIPAAVVGGALGFALLQAAAAPGGKAGEMAASLARELRGWPTPLIAVVFAGLLLERTSPHRTGEALRRGVRSAIFAWLIILGQIVAGLIVFALVVRPAHPTVPAAFGQLLEVSWAGGHGASAAMGEVYATLGFPAGRDLAFFLATAGLVYGVVSGLVLVNIAIRRRWVASPQVGTPVDASSYAAPGLGDFSTARAPSARLGLEPWALQLIILAIAFGVGYGLQQTFVRLAGVVLAGDGASAPGQALGFVRNVPLFLFTLIGGLIVRNVVAWLGGSHLIDGPVIGRMVGIAIEFLVVAAVATIRIDALRLFWLPVALLMVLGAAWSVFCLLAVAPRLLPRAYWFELGLLNYGFSTANTPQGLMLLRIVDPDMKSGAAEDYAVAAPLSAPFIGGGVVTIVVLPIALQHLGVMWIILGLTAITFALYGLGRTLGARAERS